MSLPNFMCIGATKSGTTTLYDILNQHYDIIFPFNKESHFFNIESNYSKGLNWFFKKHYKRIENNQILADATPDYIFSKKTPKRIVESFGHYIKFIIILRNPADRAFSQYRMNVKRGVEKRSFDDAIKNELNTNFNNEINSENFSYIQKGLYSEQLNNYFKYFNKNNFLILNFENDIKNNLNHTYKTICNFLNIDIKDYINLNIKSNVGYKPKSKILYYIINQLPARLFIKKIVNKKIRTYIKKYLNKLNTSSVIYPPLEVSKKKYLIENYFIDDISKLNNILNNKFSYWIDEL